MDLCFINLYWPYIDREVFWNNLLVMDCFRCPKLVFGGDLNFSLGYSEIWGFIKAHCPFKFNACWLENNELVSLLTFWKGLGSLTLPLWFSFQHGLIAELALRAFVKG